MVKFNKLIIKNYRQYKDLNFTFNDKNGLYLFVGENSQGKSNVLNAICWCLYGEEPFKTNNENHLIINDSLDFNDDPEKFIEVVVSIEVQIDDSIFTFRRSVAVNMFGETKDNSKFDAFELKSNDLNSIHLDEPEIYVNRLLPNNIRRFFLFDGEGIDSLFSENYAPKLKENILKVTDIDLIRKTIEVLRVIEKPITSKATKDFPKEKSLNDERLELEADNTKINNAITELDKSITESEKKVNELNSELTKYKFAKEYIDQRESLKIKQRALGTEVEKNKTKINKIISQKIAHVLLRNTLREYVKNITESKKEGKVPPNIRKAFLTQLLESGQCICKRPIENGSDAYKNLEKMITDVTGIDELDPIIGDRYLASQILENIDNIYSEMADLKRDISDKQEDLRKISQKLSEISDDLKSSPEQAIGDLEITLQKFKETCETNKKEKVIKEVTAKKNKERLDSIDKELREINQKKEKKTLNSLKSMFLINSQNILEKIEEDLSLEVKGLVSKETDRCFKEMIQEKGKYEKISFNDSYEVDVRKSGDESNNSFFMFGTGEKKILGLSTVKALSIVSGFKDVPVFIDGLVEFLGPDIRKNVYDTLKDFGPDKQVFMFSLDHEDVIAFGKEKIDKDCFYRIEKGSIKKFS